MQLMVDSTKKEMVKLGKSLTDSLSNLDNLYMMPDGLKGYSKKRIEYSGQFIRRTFGYQYLCWRTNSGGEKQPAKSNHRGKCCLKKIDTFLNGPFANYKKKVESLSFSLFK